jgi:dihydrofolate reductase
MEAKMRRLILYMTQTLDGFLSGPGDELDWMTFPPSEEQTRDVAELMNGADARVMGWPTAPGMVAYWEGVAVNPESPQWERDIAAAFNPVHLVAISTRDEVLDIANSELLVAKDDGELASAVDGLKCRPGRDVVAVGGVRTGQRFARLGLVDEYVLMVHPIAIGDGRPLFTRKTALHLVSATQYENGVVRMCYRPR